MKKTFTKESFLTIFATLFCLAFSFGQTTITTDAVSGAPFCSGTSISVSFATTGTFASGNVFTAQLSDESGGFDSPIATATGTSPISLAIPLGAANGSKYSVRVIGSSPATIGASSAAFVINNTPPAPYSGVYAPDFCVGDAPRALSVSALPGSTIRWYALDGTELSGAPTPSTSSPRSAANPYVYYTQTLNGCESAKGTISVGVWEIAKTPIVTNPTACQFSNATSEILSKAVTANGPSGTGGTLAWYDAQTGGNFYQGVPTPSTSVVGAQDYYVSQDYAMACPSPRVKVTLTISPASPVPTFTNPTYTKGQAASSLSATGTAIKWYDSKNSNAPLASAPVPSTTSVGTTSYWVSQNTNGCESERAEVVVTVTDCTPPAAPTVTSPVSYTVGDAAGAIKATASSGGTLNFYGTNATGGTASTTAPTPSTSTPGTTTYYVSQTIGGCESPRAQIVVTVSACTPPAAPGVSDISFCIGGPTSTLTATGSNLKWYTSASGGSALASAPKPSSASAGVTSYFVSQTVGACESARAEIKVTINETPAPNGTSPVEYCLNETASPLTATGSGLKWYTSANGGTALAGAPTPVTTATGTTRYYVSQTVNGCESQQRKEIAVVVKNPSTAPTVTATVNLCQNSTATALIASGSALKWYTAATGGTALDAAPVPSTTAVGTTSYYVSQTSSGLCEGPRAKIDVVIKDTPAAPAVTTPVNYCIGAKPVALTPSGSVYKWYNAANGGTGSATAPTPTATAAGTTSYYVTQANTYGTLSCESPRAKVDVVVNPTPAAVTPLSEAFCQERTDKNYTFATQPSTGNTLNWYTAATGGTATTATPTINLKEAKITTYYVTQLSDKGCESATRVAQKIEVKPLPAVPGITSALIEYCQFVAAKPLEATPVTNATLNWFGTDATGGTSSPNAPTPSTAEGGTTSYYVAQTLAGCIGDRAKIDVKINTTPKPTTKTYLEYCQNATATALDATGTVLKWYREANGTEWQGVPFIPFTEKVQDYSFYVTQTGSNGCESPKEEIKIHIKSLPSATISGNSTIDLGSEATLNIRFTGDGPWSYVLSNGTTGTTDQGNHQITVKPNTTTSYLITEVSNACGKGLPIGSALVTVKVPTINSGSPSVAEVCAGKPFTVPFQQSGDFPAGNTFKLQISRENSDTKFYTIPSTATASSITATFPDSTKGGTFYLRVISSGTNPEFTVKGSVSSITINLSPLPVATLTGTQTILVGETAELKADMTGKAPWTFSLNNGIKDSVITANATPYIFKLAPKTTTTYAITKVTNGCGTGNGVGTARVQVDPILGVEPQTPSNWAKVYPTVINGKATVEVTGAISPKQATIEVVDLNGRTHSARKITQKTTEVDFANEPSGLYLIRIRNGNLNTVQRVMKP